MIHNLTRSFTSANTQFGIGVDIGGTKILICVTDLEGDIVFRKKFATTTDFPQIHAYIKECLDISGITIEQVAAIGFGVPGITDSSSGIIRKVPAFRWSNVPFKSIIQQNIDRPVFVCNDVNCAALGEQWKGTAQKIDNFVFIAIGTGVGCAIVANGALIEGHDYMAGEIGYFVSDGDAATNTDHSLESFGLFEQKTSGMALSRHGNSSHLLFERYAQGDPDTLPIMKRFIADLSIGLANITSLLNPRKIIIGGGVSGSMKVVLELIRSRVAELTPIPVMIELSILGEDAGALGAAAFALKNLKCIEQRV
jgi:glucokinase